MIKHYPINLNIDSKLCLVVGGGDVAVRKVKSLLDCGARVTVVTPKADQRLIDLAFQDKISLITDHYKSCYLENQFLVIGATNDKQINKQIATDSKDRDILCNIVDQPELCSFFIPSVVRQGDLTLTVSTDGKSPAFAKHLSRQLQEQFGPEYASFINIMGEIRKDLLSRSHDPQKHKEIFEKLIKSQLLDFIKNNQPDNALQTVAEILGFR